MKFPDGFYWIDLETNDCEDEGDAMGHCGYTSADTILSLRDSKKRPHVTMAIDYDHEDGGFDYIHQCKGKNNTKPVEKYHTYIVDLLCNKTIGIENIENDEYNSKDDFHLTDLNEVLFNKLINKNPKLFLSDITMLEKNDIEKIVEIQPQILNIDSSKKNNKFNLLKLAKEGFIPIEDLIQRLEISDGVAIDNKLYMKFDSDYSEMSIMFDEDDDVENGESSKEIYQYYMEESLPVDVEKLNFDFIPFNLEHKKYILNSIEENIDESEYSEFLEKYNIKGSLIDFLYPEDDELRKNRISLFDDLMELDCFDDTKREVENAYVYAYQEIYYENAFNACIQPIKDFFLYDYFEKDGVKHFGFDPQWLMVLKDDNTVSDGIAQAYTDRTGYTVGTLLHNISLIAMYYKEFEDEDLVKYNLHELPLNIKIPSGGFGGAITDEKLMKGLQEYL